MIISVHTPKTGGISFRNELSKQFGERLKLDYADFPLNKSLNDRMKELAINKEYFDNYSAAFLSSYDCVHGHFMPYKYSSLNGSTNVKFVTWLRDPVERIGSHYHFWRRVYNPNKSKALHRKVVEEDWSLEKFAFSSEMQNVYAQFFWGFPVSEFSFIGITEFFREELEAFNRLYLNGGNFVENNLNKNPDKPRKYFSDQSLIKDIRDFHAEDCSIYEYALSKRFERIAQEQDT